MHISKRVALAAALALVSAAAAGGVARATVNTYTAPNILNNSAGGTNNGPYTTSYVFDNNNAESSAAYSASQNVVNLYTTDSSAAGADPYTPDPFLPSSQGPTPVTTQGSVPAGQAGAGEQYLQWSREDMRTQSQNYSNGGSLATGSTLVMGVNLATIPEAGWSLGNADYGRPTGYLNMSFNAGVNASNNNYPYTYSVQFGLVNRGNAPGATAPAYAGTTYTSANYGNWVAPTSITPELKITFSSGDGTVSHSSPDTTTPQMQFLVPAFSTQASLENTPIEMVLTKNTVDFTVGGLSVIGGPQAVNLVSGFTTPTSYSTQFSVASDNGNIHTEASGITGDTTAASSLAQINSLTFGDIPAAVPEPATLSLLGIGAIGLLNRRRRNKA